MISLMMLAAELAEPGTAEGRCRPDEPGPAIEITVTGLKDAAGKLRAELYPDNDQDFLAADTALIQAHKTFRRAVITPPGDGTAHLCLRVPAPGSYALAVVHDRNGTRKFDLFRDGAGFAGNPKLGWKQPPAAAARIVVSAGITETTVVMNYYRGLVSFGPLPAKPR
jgi:uncharacterized protein (DUF2141 family)